jgi:hypothetical protein
MPEICQISSSVFASLSLSDEHSIKVIVYYKQKRILSFLKMFMMGYSYKIAYSFYCNVHYFILFFIKLLIFLCIRD